jgi:dihydropteroate synthase
MLNQHPHLVLSQPRLMAIINAPPDSFSDGGLLYRGASIDHHKVVNRLREVVKEGADIIDVGGESTRPGAVPVSVQEELDRVIPIVEWVALETGLAISVDTSSPEVMLEAAKKGAHMINDVRALEREGALEAAVKTGLTVCLMHMQGAPSTMQDAPIYDQVVDEVGQYLQERIAACLEKGIAADNICIDPGFGFGKTLAHNLILLQQLPKLADLGFPLLVGLSRKSMIGHLLKREIEDRLPASLALAMMSLERKASILRVHDVRATRDIIDTFVAVNTRMCT